MLTVFFKWAFVFTNRSIRVVRHVNIIIGAEKLFTVVKTGC